MTLPCIHQFFELFLFTRGLYNAFSRFGSACDKINTEVFPLTWKLKLFGKRTLHFQNTFHFRFSFVFGLLCSVFYGGKLRLKTKAQGTAGLASSDVGSRFRCHWRDMHCYVLFQRLAVPSRVNFVASFLCFVMLCCTILCFVELSCTIRVLCCAMLRDRVLCCTIFLLLYDTLLL